MNYKPYERMMQRRHEVYERWAAKRGAEAMSLSPTEDAIRFLGELAAACNEGTIAQYVEEWLDSPEAQAAAVRNFQQAATAMRLLYDLGEYIHVHSC